jgi:hypothetical protein
MDAAQSILRRKMISSTAHKRNKISWCRRCKLGDDDSFHLL